MSRYSHDMINLQQLPNITQTTFCSYPSNALTRISPTTAPKMIKQMCFVISVFSTIFWGRHSGSPNGRSCALFCLAEACERLHCSLLSFPHPVRLQTTATTTTTTTTTPTTTPHRLLLLLRLLFSFFFLQDLLCHALHGIRNILRSCPQFLFLRFGLVCVGCTPDAACTGLSSITSFSICILVGNGYLTLPSLPNRDLRKRWTRCLFLIAFSRS